LQAILSIRADNRAIDNRTFCLYNKHMQIEYDPAKDASNRKKHGISLYDATRFDWDTAHIKEDTRHDYGEQRFTATGYIGQRLYVLIFCMRGDTPRAISLRRAEKYEERRYAEA